MAKVFFVEFVRLLNRLEKSQVRIRFRLSDRTWRTEFLKILEQHDPNTVYVSDGEKVSFILLEDVAEFDLEEPFEGFASYIHYEVSND